MQRPPLWVGGDPNPGCAINVNEDGTYVVLPGYFFYKQVSHAGQPGMAVAHTISMDSEIPVIGFSSNGTKNRNAFVVVNTSTNKEKPAVIEIKGTTGRKFRALTLLRSLRFAFCSLPSSRLRPGNRLWQLILNHYVIDI